MSIMASISDSLIVIMKRSLIRAMTKIHCLVTFRMTIVSIHCLVVPQSNFINVHTCFPVTKGLRSLYCIPPISFWLHFGRSFLSWCVDASVYDLVLSLVALSLPLEVPCHSRLMWAPTSIFGPLRNCGPVSSWLVTPRYDGVAVTRSIRSTWFLFDLG
jgi:hypothetical protein